MGTDPEPSTTPRWLGFKFKRNPRLDRKSEPQWLGFKFECTDQFRANQFRANCMANGMVKGLSEKTEGPTNATQ